RGPAFYARGLRIFLADAAPRLWPKLARHRPRLLQCVASRPRSLPLSQFGTVRSPMSILRVCRRTAPSNSRSTWLVDRQFGERELCRHTFLRRIAGSLFALSLRHTRFRSPTLSRSP